MMQNIKHKIKIICIVLGVVVIVIAIYLIFQKKSSTTPPLAAPLAMTNTTPSNGSTSVSVFDPISITFNQKIDPLTITVTSTPSENWTFSQNSPDVLTLNHQQYLRVFTTYKLTIMQHGNQVGTLTFVTAQEQNDPRFLQNLQSNMDKNYPLIAKTPYETSYYRVVYSAPLTLEIDLKQPTSQQDAISQVKDWVKSNGVNPTTHKYVVVALSPSP